MVDLIQQKECDIHYTVEQLKVKKSFFGGEKRKPAGKVGVSAELEPQPVHIMTSEADETRPELHAKVQAGFVSVALDAAIRLQGC